MLTLENKSLPVFMVFNGLYLLQVTPMVEYNKVNIEFRHHIRTKVGE